VHVHLNIEVREKYAGHLHCTASSLNMVLGPRYPAFKNHLKKQVQGIQIPNACLSESSSSSINRGEQDRGIGLLFIILFYHYSFCFCFILFLSLISNCVLILARHSEWLSCVWRHSWHLFQEPNRAQQVLTRMARSRLSGNWVGVWCVLTTPEREAHSGSLIHLQRWA